MDKMINLLVKPPNPMDEIVDRACNPALYEPNLALNMEICDIINQKKKNYPRYAAIAIVNKINSRDPTVALLSLSLLDHCVKNCGYPFHLQISTKEFLNELVRRFPSQPPLGYNPVESRILELLEQWEFALCQKSRHKDDFKHIIEMKKLLKFRGYRFPKLSKEAVAVMNPNEGLKTEEELEEEDQTANAAKLDELLRRGTPADLEAANDLMKVMAGYDRELVPDYKKQVEDELKKIEKKALQLNTAIIESKNKSNLSNPEIQDMVASCKQAQSKIQTWVTETENEERIAYLLSLNDTINVVLKKYTDAKEGKEINDEEIVVPSLVVQQQIEQQIEVKKQKEVESQVPLIDFDSDPIESTSSNKDAIDNSMNNSKINGSSQSSLLDDLNGLSFSDMDQSFGIGGSIALTLSPTNQKKVIDKNKPMAPSTSSAYVTPAISQVNNKNDDLFNLSWNTVNPENKSQTSPPLNNTNNNLAAAVPSNTSSTTQQSNNLLDMDDLNVLSTSPQKNNIPNINSSTQNNSNDIWEFQTAPVQNQVTEYQNDGLKIKMEQESVENNVNKLNLYLSNEKDLPMDNIVFQVAVPKSMKLKLGPLSSKTIPPKSSDSVQQSLSILNPNNENIKVRFRIQYEINNEKVMTQGDLAF